jgi:hypothetical protein
VELISTASNTAAYRARPDPSAGKRSATALGIDQPAVPMWVSGIAMVGQRPGLTLVAFESPVTNRRLARFTPDPSPGRFAIPNRAATIALLAATMAGPLHAKDRAASGAASVEAAFGNTILSTYADGRTGELWLSSDGSYTAEGRRHDPSHGHWSVKGQRLCLKQVKPVPVPFSFCTPIPKAGMGQAWAAKAATGDAITVKVVTGRFDPGRQSHKG